jgi:1-deoxy-D-xylulose-5-phosphate synthase
MTVLRGIRSPEDLRALAAEQLPALAQEIRAELVEKVTRSGGHLGPNLGVVELTIALHRVYRSPQDVLVFDTGHQSYVHKMLTGRLEGFEHLRQEGHLSGYPSRAESEHDVVENSHASTVLGRRHREGVRAHGGAGASTRRRHHRRRSAHRWHGVGGDQQHRRST